MSALTSTTASITAVLNSTLSSLSENSTSGPSLTTSNILIGVVVELVILVLIFGNLLMVVTLLLYKPWSIADLLLFSLSLADVINGTIPAHILNVMNNFYGQNLWTPSLCALFIWLTFSLRMTSVCTITLISAERSLMLTRPLRHHSVVTIQKARIAVIAVWLFSAFLAALPFMGAGKSGYANGYCYYQLYDLGIAFGCTIEAIGFIQLLLVLACFISIRLSSGEFIKRQSVMAAANQTGGNMHQKAKETSGTKQIKQLSKMMAIVVILYYVSWLPYLLTNLVSLIHGHLPHAVEIIVGFLSLVNAIINPLLYGKMSLRYRRGYQFILRKVLSICGGQKPDGQFFDADKRKASQAATYSMYSHAMKRASVAAVDDVEVQQHTNRAFEVDEQNHYHHDYKVDSSSNNPAFENDDEDDNNNDGITIYPVEINKKYDQEDDDDDNNETQISICPFNESTHFDNINEGIKNPNANAEDEDTEAKASTVDEEDFSICPYDESIVAHFEDLKKLVEDDDEDDMSSNEDLSNSNTNLDSENSKQNSAKFNSQQKKDLDINIPGAVLNDTGNDDSDDDDYNYSASSNSKGKDLEFPTPNYDKLDHSKELAAESDSSSKTEPESEEDSNGSASDSYGEGSILGNYDVAGNWLKNQENSDSEDEDDEKEEEKSSESSSKGSAEGNLDIIDLLEKESKAEEPVAGQGHFFVDDIVKRMEEDQERKHSMESFDLLSEDINTKEEQLVGEETLLNDATEKLDRKEATTSENENSLEKEKEKDEDQGDREDDSNKKEDKNVIKENTKEKQNEKEEKQFSLDNKDTVQKDFKVENGIETDKHGGDCQAEKKENKDKKKTNHDKEDQDKNSEQSDENGVDFRGHESIFKIPKSEVSGRKKLSRTVSDLLRRELGEI